MESKIQHPQPARILMLFVMVLFLFSGENRQAFGKSERGWLGVSVREMTPSMREEMQLGERSGLLIVNLVPDSPAEEAGLREDDVITRYDGKAVEKIEEFLKLVRNTAPETEVTLEIVRDGQVREIALTLGKRAPGRWHYWGSGDKPYSCFWTGRPRLGIQVHELNNDLAAYFKGAEEGGVLILSVTEDSPAAKAGLKAGDVITRLDENAIGDPQELIELLQDYQEGELIKLAYVRKGESRTVEVELETAKDFRAEFLPYIHPRILRHEFYRPRRHKDIEVIIPHPHRAAEGEVSI